MLKKIIALLFLILYGIAAKQISAAEDWQLWSNLGIDGKLNQTIKIEIDTEFRGRNQMSELNNQFVDLSVQQKFSSWFSLALAYRHIYDKSTEWKSEYRPHISPSFTFALGPLKIQDRNRFEMRLSDDKDTSYRYRNNLTIGYPVVIGTLTLEPYIADEIFYDLSISELTRNRASLGSLIKFGGNFTFNVFYMRQSSVKDNQWTNLNIIGISTTISF